MFPNSENSIEDNSVSFGHLSPFSSSDGEMLYFWPNYPFLSQNYISDSLQNDTETKENENNIEIHISKDIKENKKNLFNITKINNSCLGRKRKGENKREINERCHDKFRCDNMQIKIQSHYITFINDFTNSILECLGYEGSKFYKIDYKYKSKINKNFVSSLKSLSIGDILSQNISPKFSKQNKDKNKLVYKQIENIPGVKNLLSLNYLELFKNIYYKNERNINLSCFGKNINIYLSKEKVEMFEDLLEKNSKDNVYDESKGTNKINQNKEYIQALEKYVKKKYLNSN